MRAAIVLILLTAALIACAPEPATPKTSVPQGPETPAPEAAEPAAPPPPAPEPEPEQEMSRIARQLQEKAPKVKSYSFSYAELPENKANRKYYVKGDLVRVELTKHGLLENGDQYDTIYLDRAEERAVAYCELNPVICKKDGVIFRPEYEEYDIVYPQEFMAGITAGEDLGSLTHEDAVSQRIAFMENGDQYRLTVHKFYGIPVLIEIFDNTEFSGEATGHAYREMTFNLVTDEQMTPPDGW